MDLPDKLNYITNAFSRLLIVNHFQSQFPKPYFGTSILTSTRDLNRNLSPATLEHYFRLFLLSVNDSVHEFYLISYL